MNNYNPQDWQGESSGGGILETMQSQQLMQLQLMQQMQKMQLAQLQAVEEAARRGGAPFGARRRGWGLNREIYRNGRGLCELTLRRANAFSRPRPVP